MGFLFRVPPPPAGSGYFAGGYKTVAPAGNTAFIDALDFSTEATRSAVSSISTARRDLAGMNSSTKAYFAGGSSTAITGMVFAGETSTTLTAVLSTTRNDPAGVNSSSAGYFGGGADGSGNSLASADKLTFSTETITALSNRLADGGRFASAGVNSSSTGYFGGGSTGTSLVNWIDGIVFSNDTTTNPSATLVTARRFLAGFNSSTRGYFAGGQINTSTGATTTEIDGIDFGTNAAINPTAALTQTRYAPFGVNSSAKGYVAGGGATAGLVDAFTFTTEAVAALSATMATDKYNGGSAQSGSV